MKNTFEHSWRIENGKVYWGISGKPMRGADPETFEPLNKIWARDKKRVFVYDGLLRGADAATFEVLNMLYARDKDMAYYSFGRIKDAKPDSFTALDEGIKDHEYSWLSYSGYATDGDKVYHYSLTVGKPSLLRGADPSSFKSLRCDFAKDSKRAYRAHTRIPKANASTFRVLGYNYATDGTRVFYGNRIVAGADPESFKTDPQNGISAFDMNNRYERDQKVT